MRVIAIPTPDTNGDKPNADETNRERQKRP
jgi:hypothetical protein